jgi:iron(III) transport system ATP-binding protein
VTDPHGTLGLVVEHVSHRFGGLLVVDDMNIEIAPAEVVCLLGPSGCGKTTTLRIIAGLEDLQHGRIVVDGRTVADGSVNLPPEERSASLLFQDFALFPHLTVYENVVFGLNHLGPAERDKRAREVLAQVGMLDSAGLYPHVLSGGQQQRVALARARAPRPRMMLLDEPFSNLDVGLRAQVRDLVLHVLKNTTSMTLMVTHDPEEAMFMADRIAVMREGRIVQQGTPEELYRRPADAYVMRLFGEVNRMGGVVEAGHVATPLGPACAPGLPDGARADVLVRAEGVVLDDAGPVRGRVITRRMLGRSSILHISVPGADGEALHLHARVSGVQGPRENDEVGLAFAEEHVFVFPQGDGEG